MDHILKDHIYVQLRSQPTKQLISKNNENTCKTAVSPTQLPSCGNIWNYTKLSDYGLLRVVITKLTIVNDKRFGIYLKYSAYWTKRHTCYNTSKYEMSISNLWFHNWQHALRIEMLAENTDYDIFSNTSARGMVPMMNF